MLRLDFASYLLRNDPVIRRALSVFFLFSLCAMFATAQSPAGFPPYGTFQNGGLDVINWQDLNVHLAFPIVNKPGRGLNFNYVLSYDSSIWSISTKTVSGKTTSAWGASNGGWRGASEAGVGYYTLRGHPGFDSLSYNDSMGTTHPFPDIVPSSPPATTVTEFASDGSGYLATLQYNSTSYDYALESIIDIGGNTIIPPPNAYSGSGSITDPNGNSFSTSTGANNTQTFIDTLGMTVLTIPENSYGFPTSYTYTGPATTVYPNGTPETVTVNYASYTVATNFGCSGITDFPPTATSLVSSIVYPDGSKYNFKYQLTGGSFGNDVTGEISEVDLPTGGSVKYTYTFNSDPCNVNYLPITGLTRQTSDGAIWQYSSSNAPAGTYGTITTVTDPALNQTVSSFGEGGVEVLQSVYQGNATSGGTLLQTTTTCYTFGSESEPCTTPTGSAYPPTSVTTIVQPSGGKATQTVEYNGLTCAGACQLNLPTEIDTYDFGATAPTQVQKISYAVTRLVIAKVKVLAYLHSTNWNCVRSQFSRMNEATCLVQPQMQFHHLHPRYVVLYENRPIAMETIGSAEIFSSWIITEGRFILELKEPFNRSEILERGAVIHFRKNVHVRTQPLEESRILQIGVSDVRTFHDSRRKD